MTPNMDQMTVFVDGKPELREVYSVTFGEGGRPVRTPVLAEDEQMRETVDGKIHIFKVQKSDPNRVVELRYEPGCGELPKYIVGFADGREREVDKGHFDFLRAEMEHKYDR